MTRLEEIINKYDFYYGEGNPKTDSIMDADTTWLVKRVELLKNVTLEMMGCLSVIAKGCKVPSELAAYCIEKVANMDGMETGSQPAEKK